MLGGWPTTHGRSYDPRLAGLVFAAVPAASALAKTIGQTGGNVGCPGESAYGDSNHVVPSGGGTIMGFSFRSDSSNTGRQLDFLALRPTGSGGYTVVGKTGLITWRAVGSRRFPPTSRFGPATSSGSDQKALRLEQLRSIGF